MTTVTRLDYCQFLLVSQTNDTVTYFAEHSEGISHDAVKRSLEVEKITARLVWENGREQVVGSPPGYLAFDDTVLDHSSAFKIDLVRRKYSGNVQGLIKGIGVVNCVSSNPELDHQFWIIDYRIYDPAGDAKTTLDHVRERLNNGVSDKQLLFRGVVMAIWYIERKRRLPIEQLKKVYDCPLKDNCLVDDSDAQRPYQRIDTLQWTDDETHHGKALSIKALPKGHRVKLFRLVLSTKRTTTPRPTTCLRIPPRTHERCVPCAGRLSSFIVNPNTLLVLRTANVV